jgi:hypothetical protein
MERTSSSYTTLQLPRDLWIPSDSQLLNSMLANDSLDPEVIQGEIDQCRLRIERGHYPFPALSDHCRTVDGRSAIRLCNDYFCYLAKHSELATWLGPRAIAELAIAHGLRATAECRRRKESDQTTYMVTTLLSWVPKTAETVRNLLVFCPPTAHSQIILKASEVVIRVSLFESALAHIRQKEQRAEEILRMAGEYLEKLSPLPLSPPFTRCFQERLAMLTANEGMRATNECHTVDGFERLITAINNLFHRFPEGRLDAKRILEPLPDGVSKALLLKMLDGLQGSDLFFEVVIRTQDDFFTPEEWDRLGEICIQMRSPTRLWLAVGANATSASSNL